MADEEVDFEEAVELGDAPMEETAGAASGGGKKGRDATGRRSPPVPRSRVPTLRVDSSSARRRGRLFST